MYDSPMDPRTPYKGRGAPNNPPNRFEELHVERETETDDPDDPAPGTRFFVDRTRTILARNDSPDIGFSFSINPYRGCEHGCIYCYARPFHEYLGLSAGLDFETKIFVKTEAPRLLRHELMKPSWKPVTIVMSGVTDCYQPVERRLKITRQCLEVLAEFRQPVGLITKNALITRDIDVLSELARYNAVSVTVSVTTLVRELQQILEPRTSIPSARLAAIHALAKAGIPIGVNVAPIIPGLTDHEMPAILNAAREAGAIRAGYTMIRLPYAVAPLFEKWLEVHRPLAKDKVLHRIREMRGGKLYDSRWGTRMTGEGIYAEHLDHLFDIAVRKAGFPDHTPHLTAEHFRRSSGPQLQLFEEDPSSQS
jgi:DNA repair photolyase